MLRYSSSYAAVGHSSEQAWQFADENVNTELNSVMLRPTTSDSLYNVINTVCLQFLCIWKLRQTFCWNVNSWLHDWWSSGLQIYLKSRKQRSCLTLDKPLVVTKGAALGGCKCCHQSWKSVRRRHCHNLLEARISNTRQKHYKPGEKGEFFFYSKGQF